MSAITGIIGPRLLHSDSASDLASMVRALWGGCSANNDTAGSFRPESIAAHVAWVRREFEPLFAGWNDRRDICLVFTGEEFDAKVATSSSATSQVDAESSAQALIRLYETHGTAFINDLNGRFSGVVCDLRTGITHLFNDRYGLNRVYTHATVDGFFFSSEAKALLAVLPGLRKIDPQGRAEYLAVGCVLQNRSLFAGITLLPPGSCWSFHPDGTIRKRRYFDPSVLENQEPLTASEFSDRLADLFGRISSKYMTGPGSVGMSLTGGLDSRMILAWSRAAPGGLPCYTFGGPYRDCADVRIARCLAAVAQQPHTTLRISSDFFARFVTLAEQTVLATDGAMDVSGAVELYVNQLARQIAPIRITGNYGSEILRSNIAFRPRRIDLRLFAPEFRPFLEEAAATYRREAAGHRLSFIAFKQVPWHHFARFAAERSQLTPRSPFLDNELVALAYRAPRALEGSAGPILTAITKGNSALDTVDTDRALLRGTIPFLSPISRTWQEFTAKAEYAYDYGMPRWLAQTDSAFRLLHLERLFLGRHKFYHFRVWYRDQLAPALHEHVSHHDQPSCYVEGMAKQLVREHTSGRVNRTLELHQLLSVQLIDRLLNREVMPQLILFSFFIFAVWLIRRDTASRSGISPALWIPTIWVGILASRPVTSWIGGGGGGSTLDGSPVDRMFYLSIILASLYILSRRSLNLGWLIAKNWPILIFYAFLLISVTWANSPFASFKRWFKESGNIIVALVILSEANPQQAFRAVFVRCALVLIPLSMILLRWFPAIGRGYNIHSGTMEAVGVTHQKNALGTMILVCGLIFFWDWLERTKTGESRRSMIDRLVAVGVGVIAVWLLYLCDSKTSIVALATGAFILTAIRLPLLHRRVSAFGTYALIAVAAFFLIDQQIGISETIIKSLGRDMTFTGRTEVWRELLNVGTDRLLGTGFMSFWDDMSYQDRLPNWVAFSAHNGYLEIFLAGGYFGVTMLVLMLLGTAAKINRCLRSGTEYSVARFAIFVMALIANFSESNFACMSPLGILFLLAAIGEARPGLAHEEFVVTASDPYPMSTDVPTEQGANIRLQSS